MRQPADILHGHMMLGGLALFRGDLAERERTLRESDAPLGWRAFLTGSAFLLRLEQARLAEFERELVEQATMHGESVLFASMVVLMNACLGRGAEARQGLKKLSADGFGALAQNPGQSLGCAALLAHALWLLDEPAQAPALYERLLPYPNLNPVVVRGALGSVSHYLGLLATTMGNWEDAERHFSDGLAMNERIGTRPFAAHTRYAWADMLVRRSARDDRELALGLVDEALAEAESMGMTWLAGRALALKVRLQGIVSA
jgi:tetratricopeptide (TPR) repeat protein